MKFKNTAINGAYLVELDRIEDDRGFFARIFCKEEFDKIGMESTVVQTNLSHNKQAGTLRGLHFQIEPAPETKFVRCVRGSISDVIVDMRPSSPTFRAHISVELSAANGNALFIPHMCAHGFQTLEDDTDVMYMVSGLYTPECERGLRYNDPSLSIDWPKAVTHVSDKDQQWPLLPGLSTSI